MTDHPGAPSTLAARTSWQGRVTDERRAHGQWEISTPGAAFSTNDPPTALVTGRGVAEALSDPEGLLEADGRLRPRGRRDRLSYRRRGNTGPGRGERLREDHHRTLYSAGHRADRGRDLHAARGRFGGRDGRVTPVGAAGAASRDADDLPGSVHLAQSPHDAARSRRRTVAGPRHEAPARP